MIIQKINTQDQAIWYTQKIIENGWSRNVLALQIESQLYERQPETPKIDNFNGRLPSPDSDLFRESTSG